MTRVEHLQWAKDRALAELEYSEDIGNAFASMGSDLGKHPELENHPGLMLGMSMLLAGHIASPKQMKEFIEGFN